MDSDNVVVIGAGVVVTGIVEGLKWLWRKLIVKDMSYDFPVLFYALAVPVLNALAPFALFGLGVLTNDPILNMSWQAVVVYLLRILGASFITFLAYNSGVKPLKDADKKNKLLRKQALFARTARKLPLDR